jgi:hypothetical protein
MTPPSPDFQQYSLMIFAVGLGACVAIVAGISTVYKNIVLARAVKNPARNPPSEEEAAKTYATKAELATFRCEFREQCSRNHDRVDKTLGELFSINRALTKELTDRLDKYHAALAEWQRGMERQIGHLEGKINNES